MIRSFTEVNERFMQKLLLQFAKFHFVSFRKSSKSLTWHEYRSYLSTTLCWMIISCGLYVVNIMKIVSGYKCVIALVLPFANVIKLQIVASLTIVIYNCNMFIKSVLNMAAGTEFTKGPFLHNLQIGPVSLSLTLH